MREWEGERGREKEGGRKRVRKRDGGRERGEGGRE